MASEISKGKEKRKLARTDRTSPHGGPTGPQQHSFLTDPSEVKKMEKDLLDLMKDFNEGKLHAFGMKELKHSIRNPNNIQITKSEGIIRGGRGCFDTFGILLSFYN